MYKNSCFVPTLMWKSNQFLRFGESKPTLLGEQQV